MVEIVGFVAGTLTALAFLPQVIKTWRTRSTGDLSTAMLLAQSVGVALWIVYGVAIYSLPVIMANTFTLVLTLFLLGCKRAYRATGRMAIPGVQQRSSASTGANRAGSRSVVCLQEDRARHDPDDDHRHRQQGDHAESPQRSP